MLPALLGGVFAASQMGGEDRTEVPGQDSSCEMDPPRVSGLTS